MTKSEAAMAAANAALDRFVARKSKPAAQAVLTVPVNPRVAAAIKDNPGGVSIHARAADGTSVMQRLAPVQPPARRDLYEEMYWSAVKREFAGPTFAEVGGEWVEAGARSAYDPFAKERMPGYDGE